MQWRPTLGHFSGRFVPGVTLRQTGFARKLQYGLDEIVVLALSAYFSFELTYARHNKSVVVELDELTAAVAQRIREIPAGLLRLPRVLLYDFAFPGQ